MSNPGLETLLAHGLQLYYTNADSGGLALIARFEEWPAVAKTRRDGPWRTITPYDLGAETYFRPRRHCIAWLLPTPAFADWGTQLDGPFEEARLAIGETGDPLAAARRIAEEAGDALSTLLDAPVRLTPATRTRAALFTAVRDRPATRPGSPPGRRPQWL